MNFKYKLIKFSSNKFEDIDDSISIEEDEHERERDKPNPIIELFNRVQVFYTENELTRYATWSLLLILISTSALTIIEYDMFNGSVKEHTEGSFIFGDKEPNGLDTFFHTFWWSIVTFTTVGYGDVSPVTHLGKLLTIIVKIGRGWNTLLFYFRNCRLRTMDTRRLNP
mgnify:CR=1 FL=1